MFSVFYKCCFIDLLITFCSPRSFSLFKLLAEHELIFYGPPVEQMCGVFQWVAGFIVSAGLASKKDKTDFSLVPLFSLLWSGKQIQTNTELAKKKKDSLWSDLVPGSKSLHRYSRIYMGIFGFRGATSWHFGPTVCGNCLEIWVFKSRKWQLILGTVVFYSPSQPLGSAKQLPSSCTVLCHAFLKWWGVLLEHHKHTACVLGAPALVSPAAESSPG